jgi:hypothetical protein
MQLRKFVSFLDEQRPSLFRSPTSYTSSSCTEEIWNRDAHGYTWGGSASHIYTRIRSNRSCFQTRLPPVRESPTSNIRMFAEPVIQILVMAAPR